MRRSFLDDARVDTQKFIAPWTNGWHAISQSCARLLQRAKLRRHLPDLQANSNGIDSQKHAELADWAVAVIPFDACPANAIVFDPMLSGDILRAETR